MFQEGFGDIDPADMLDMITEKDQRAMNEVIDLRVSDIQRFYSDSTVFVTGGTGFLGKLLIEKLFRSCNIKTVFMLMRGKKGKTMQQRFEETLNDPVFERLREKQPRFAERIVLVEGDIAEIGLGINDLQWKIISEEVDMIFHIAATTRFDEVLRVATLINVRGTREVIKLAKNCKKLRSFVHVSTAYCVATFDRIGSEVKEQFYPSPVPPDAMIQLAEDMEAARLKAITPQMISGWPNTYTFTKALGEEMVRKMSGELPVCIVRPSIVISTYSEPTPGWLDMTCAYGAGGIVLGICTAILRVLLVRTDMPISFMPADYVNNITIAAGWDAVTKREDVNEPKIYNISSTRSNVTFSKFSNALNARDTIKWSSPRAIWYCFLIETKNKILFWTLFWLLHYIPAYFVDGACHLFRVRLPEGIPPFVKIYTKVEKLTALCMYFMTNEWDFRDENVISMQNRMCPLDRAIYNYDITQVDWTQMMLTWALGTRKFLIKDGLKDSAYGCRKQKWLRVAHYTLVILYFYIFYKILSVIYHSMEFMFYY